MRVVRLLPRPTAVLAVSALALAAACSSDSSTGPGTLQNVSILSRFDSLSTATDDNLRAQALADIAQLLAQGAPIGRATIRVNGVGGPFTAIAAWQVNSIGGEPVDSEYTLAGWEGNAPDSVIVLTLHGGQVSAIVSSHHGSVSGTGGTATLTAQTGSGACTSFASEAPSDLAVPTPSSCALQRSQVSFSSTFDDLGAFTVDVPVQSMQGIRLAFDTPPV